MYSGPMLMAFEQLEETAFAGDDILIIHSGGASSLCGFMMNKSV